MVIVDTSVWIDYLHDTVNRQTIWLEDAIGKYEIGLTSLILCEILQGVRTESLFHECLQKISQCPIFDTGSAELAILSAKNYRTLRDQGITVRRTIDCIIATFCIEFGHQLLHNDRDFDAFEKHLKLRVIHLPVVPYN